MGAFKYRGAYNAISQLTPTERNRGLITFSSGNHAQAIARVGHDLGPATTILSGTVQAKGRVGIILSGENIDADTISYILRTTASFNSSKARG
ncbi:MAG: pyridoxal-phosphate dependent enzyme [Synechococcus sp.]